MFENLTLKSVIRFKNEPALWGGALLAVVTAARDANSGGADWQTVAVAAVAAVVAFIVRGKVSPV